MVTRLLSAPVPSWSIISLVLAPANAFTDIAGNANVAITKNITQINTLKDLVDIDGKGSDVDLTHWGLY
jgi:hypothetical protein